MLFFQNINFPAGDGVGVHRWAELLVIRSAFARVRSGLAGPRAFISLRLQRKSIPRDLVSVANLHVISD